MMEETNAHSGANPEPTAELETDTNLAPAIDNNIDDEETREIVRPETISAPVSEPDDDEDDECDEYIDPGYTVIYDRIKDAFVHVPKNAEPADVAPEAEPPSAAPVPSAPSGTLSLLEAQLGEGLKIMRDLAEWIHHPQANINICIPVTEAVGSLVRASAELAKVAVRLQTGDPESRHRVIVEYADAEGGGVRQTRKRLSRGRS